MNDGERWTGEGDGVGFSDRARVGGSDTEIGKKLM